MPDVGVLNLTIRDNSNEAATGLDQLARKLKSVKSAAEGYNLSEVKSQINGLVAEARGSEKAVASLGTLLNAISTYQKTVAKLGKTDINTKPIEKIKAAIGDGIKIGNAGSQLNQLRDALGGTWNSEGAVAASDALKVIADGAKSIEGHNLGSVAKDIKAIAKALDEYATASSRISGAVGDNASPNIFASAQGAQSQEDGRNLVAGVVEGMKSEKASAAATGTEIVEAIDNAIKTAADMHSPSLLEFDNGENLVEGLKEGIRSKMSSLTALVTDMIQSAIAASSGKTSEVANQVAIAVKTAYSSALGSMDLSDAQKSIIQRTANVTADFIRSFASSSNSDLSNVAKISAEALSTAMSGATEKALEATDPLKDSFVAVGDRIETAGKSAEEVLAESIQAAATENDNLNKSLQQTNETIEEQVRLRREAIDIQRDAKLEIANDTKNALKESQISGYGTVGSIRDLYASTDLRTGYVPGPDLRGDNGYLAKVEARNQIAEITGMPIEAINKQLIALGNDARKAKTEVQDLIDSLNKPMDWGNLSQGIDRMMGIGNKKLTPEDWGIDAFVTEASKQVASLMDELNRPMDWGNLSQGIDRMHGIGEETKSAEDSMRAFLEAMGEESAQAQQLQVNNPELARFKQTMDEAGISAKDFTGSLVDVDGELKAKKRDAADAASGFDLLKSSFNDLKKAMKTSVFGKLAKQFASIARRMAIRAVIKQVTAAFKEGTEHVYRYSQAIGSSFASDLDNAASSLAQMKNAIGAAIAPAIQAVLPYINQLINGFISAINYVNQFFSLLQGKNTWTRALTQTTKAFDDQKKSANGASKAMKDLLADWDELNIIQSESGGGSGSKNAKEALDYENMFEEVKEFDSFLVTATDFIKDNMEDVVGLAKKAGLTLLGWKLSRAFTGPLGTIGGILAAGQVLEIEWKLTQMFDSKYMETKDEGWLVADGVTNLVGSSLAGLIVTQVLNGGAGLLTVGISLLVSGAVSYGVSEVHRKGNEKNALDTLAGIKTGIGLAAMELGFGIMTGSFLVGTALTLTAAPLMFALGVGVTMVVEQLKSAKEVAEEAFTAEHEGSISVDDLYNALQDEFTKASEGYSIIVDAFSNVPTLKTDLAEAYEKVNQLAGIIRSDDSLTQEEADKFKNAWTTVFDAFRDITADSFSTVFDALNKSLTSQNAEIRKQAKDLRASLLIAKEEITEAEAEYRVEMEELIDKVAHGTATKEEKAQYEEYAQAMAESTMDAVKPIQDIVEEGTRIDFKNIEEVTSFFDKVNGKAEETINEIDQGLQAGLQGVEELKNSTEFYHSIGKIGDEEYNALMQMYTDIESNITATADENKKKVEDAVKNGYATILESALNGLDEIPDLSDGNSDLYLTSMDYMYSYIQPIIAAIQDAGGTVDKELADAFGIGASAKEYFSNGADTPMMNYLRKRFNIEIPKDNINVTEETKEAIKEEVTDAIENIDVEATVQADVDANAGNIVVTHDGYTVNDDDINDLYKHLNWSIADAKFEGDNRSKFQRPLNELYNSGDYDTMKQLLDQIIQYGVPEAFDRLENYLNGDGWTVGANGKFNPQYFSASAAGIHGAYNPSGEAYSPYFVYPNQQATTSEDTIMSEEDYANAVESGTSRANRDQNDILNSIMRGVDALLRKEWTVNVSPSSDWGNHNAKSGQAWYRVIGG